MQAEDSAQNPRPEKSRYDDPMEYIRGPDELASGRVWALNDLELRVLGSITDFAAEHYEAETDEWYEFAARASDRFAIPVPAEMWCDAEALEALAEALAEGMPAATDLPIWMEEGGAPVGVSGVTYRPALESSGITFRLAWKTKAMTQGGTAQGGLLDRLKGA